MSDDPKHETIVWLLEHFEDALMERTPSNGRAQHESVSLLPGPLWNEAFRELQRCLDRMCLRAAHDEIKLKDGSACSRRAARWHVMAWYVQVEQKRMIVWKEIRGKRGKHRGKRNSVPGHLFEIQRHRDARKPKADAGVFWLVSEYAWGSEAVQAALTTLRKVAGGKLQPYVPREPVVLKRTT